MLVKWQNAKSVLNKQSLNAVIAIMYFIVLRVIKFSIGSMFIKKIVKSRRLKINNSYKDLERKDIL